MNNRAVNHWWQSSIMIGTHGRILFEENIGRYFLFSKQLLPELEETTCHYAQYESRIEALSYYLDMLSSSVN
ncbi:hypothetical protein AQUCO_00900693v1 [Aquilegia coerulea]|uniref:Uncharacterized protein n=1 Tax=Aquilegia coerulea TaxID=218851 RepID=A0A2G5EEZ1_AQUCA|nr:hypothetical protein AQUCO_00900693v1 [Aquilegia coerulea]